MTNPTVAIFSSRLLPASETFIRAQGEGLQQFSSYYVGLRLVEGLPLPSDRSLVVNQGGLIGTLKEGVFKFLGLNPKLYREIRRLSPKLIHAHFGISGALALPLAKGLQVPLVVTFHGSDATMKDEYARRASYSHRIYLHRREALKKEVKLFIAVSHFIKEKLLSQGYPSDKIEVHYIGVDREAFQPDPAVTREPVVLFVGRLVEKKGCEYLIRAMGEVQKVNPNVELVVIGDGPSRPRLEELAANQLKRCKFLGIQPPGVVHSWMNRASLLAAPSITPPTGEIEGLPMVILEAQAMGLPVVSSVHAGIPEAVIHGETGFLAAEQDWQALAEYILRLLKDPFLWHRFSLSGQARVEANFDLRKQVKALENIYTAVLRDKL